MSSSSLEGDGIESCSSEHSPSTSAGKICNDNDDAAVDSQPNPKDEVQAAQIEDNERDAKLAMSTPDESNAHLPCNNPQASDNVVPKENVGQFADQGSGVDSRYPEHSTVDRNDTRFNNLPFPNSGSQMPDKWNKSLRESSGRMPSNNSMEMGNLRGSMKAFAEGEGDGRRCNDFSLPFSRDGGNDNRRNDLLPFSQDEGNNRRYDDFPLSFPHDGRNDRKYDDFPLPFSQDERNDRRSSNFPLPFPQDGRNNRKYDDFPLPFSQDGRNEKKIHDFPLPFPQEGRKERTHDDFPLSFPHDGRNERRNDFPLSFPHDGRNERRNDFPLPFPHDGRNDRRQNDFPLRLTQDGRDERRDNDFSLPLSQDGRGHRKYNDFSLPLSQDGGDAKRYSNRPFEKSSSETSNQWSRSISSSSVHDDKMNLPICEFYAKGWCIKGSSCLFRHEKFNAIITDARNLGGHGGHATKRTHQDLIGVGPHAQTPRSSGNSPAGPNLFPQRLLVREFGGHPTQPGSEPSPRSVENMAMVSPVENTLSRDKPRNSFYMANGESLPEARSVPTGETSPAAKYFPPFDIFDNNHPFDSNVNPYKTSTDYNHEKMFSENYTERINIDREKNDYFNSILKRSSSPGRFSYPIYNTPSADSRFASETKVDLLPFNSQSHCSSLKDLPSFNSSSPFATSFSMPSSSSSFPLGPPSHHFASLKSEQHDTVKFMSDGRGFKSSSPPVSSPYLLKKQDSLEPTGPQKPSFSTDWELSVPFRSSICPLPRASSSLDDQYDPLLDSMEPPTEGAFEPQNPSYSNKELPTNDMVQKQTDESNFKDQQDVDFIEPIGEKHNKKSRIKEIIGDDRVKNDIDARYGNDSRAPKNFRVELVNYMKDLVKPSWRGGQLSKDAHKAIVKRAVDKVLSSIPAHQIPSTPESINQYLVSSHHKLLRLVEGYLEKYTKA